MDLDGDLPRHAASSRAGSSQTGSAPGEDSSTDNIELRRSDSASTQHEALATRAWEPPEAPGDLEANIILIAHPEDRMLGTRFRLRPGTSIEVGRAPTLEISLPEVLSLSRTHARLTHRGAEVVVQDLGSTNGTYVNDRLIRDPQVLRSGDRFQVGAVHFKFLHERDVEHAYHEAIHNLVTRDGLTEIFNRRKFEEELRREFARARRHHRPLVLILFDIDLFKDINDRFGHLCGDFVLKHLAGRASGVLRAESVLARVGGEEFAILCPETRAEGGMTLAEKLRLLVAGAPFLYGDCEVEVTCSFGVAEMLRETRSAEDLFAAADRAMYVSKEQGRDRVTFYTSAGPTRSPSVIG